MLADCIYGELLVNIVNFEVMNDEIKMFAAWELRLGSKEGIANVRQIWSVFLESIENRTVRCASCRLGEDACAECFGRPEKVGGFLYLMRRGRDV